MIEGHKKILKKLIYSFIRQRKKLLKLKTSSDITKKERKEIEKVLDNFWTSDVGDFKRFIEEEFDEAKIGDVGEMDFDFSFDDTYNEFENEEENEYFEEEPDSLSEKLERNIWDLF